MPTDVKKNFENHNVKDALVQQPLCFDSCWEEEEKLFQKSLSQPAPLEGSTSLHKEQSKLPGEQCFFVAAGKGKINPFADF